VLARKHGFDPGLARIPHQGGIALYALDGYAHGLRLWAQNENLSAREDPAKCGVYGEMHPDPGQYVLQVAPLVPFGFDKSANDLASQLQRELAAQGYEMRSDSVLCSSWSKVLEKQAQT